ncbi:MAG: bifunctional oligoribonuclease/PAP phosphatase NrnA [Waddliaceae bacterium]
MDEREYSNVSKQKLAQWEPLLSLIEKGSHFLITTHQFPDADGIGASLAFIELLNKLGKKTRFVCDSSMPQKFRFLDEGRVFEEYNEMESYSEIEAVIIIDTHTKSRIGKVASLFENSPKRPLGVIDHHPLREKIEGASVMDSDACSSAALIWRLYHLLEVPLTKQAMQGIYAGVVWDTGRFCYTSTTLESHEIAKESLRLGVDPTNVYSHLYQHVSYEQFTVFAHAIERVETYCDHRIIVQQILHADYEEMGEKSTEIEQMDFESIHEFNKLIHEVEVVVLLSEQLDGSIRISLRSKTDLDVSKVVEPLGGGGHRKAAGALWKGSIDDAKTHILELLFPLMDRNT